MRILAALAFLAVSASAHAGWSLSADLEAFRWEESSTPSVSETGPRYGFGWGFTQQRPEGWQFAYRGQFRRGTVHYTGALLFDPSQAVTARVRYTGIVNEAQGIYRFPQSIGMELVGGLGYDYWERNILPNQREEYSVVFLRLGFNLDPRAPQGWFGGAGVKLPFYVSENAHMDELGFNQNERLHPKGETSFYAQAGYRFNPRWSLIGYYDGYRFGESKPVRATAASSPGTQFLLFQPASTLETFGVKLQYDFQ
jgi:hypothetical protein